ncbi:hypothetical protein V1505DRAFT_381315 [Lipomyces doorenjongii]
MTEYLNTLNLQQRNILYSRMTRTAGTGLIAQIPPGSLRGCTEAELSSYTNPLADRDGLWWINRLKCQTFAGIKPATNGHIRWQPRLETGIQLKLWTHHVAYSTTANDPLPTNLGHGSSIDHLCGGKACHNPQHLALATAHKSNCNRIGCTGIILLVYQTKIVAEFPCTHSAQGTLSHQLSTSCIKCTVYQLNEENVRLLV